MGPHWSLMVSFWWLYSHPRLCCLPQQTIHTMSLYWSLMLANLIVHEQGSVTRLVICTLLSSAHWQQASKLSTLPSAVSSFLMTNSAIQKWSIIIVIIIIISLWRRSSKTAAYPCRASRQWWAHTGHWWSVSDDVHSKPPPVRLLFTEKHQGKCMWIAPIHQQYRTTITISNNQNTMMYKKISSTSSTLL